VAVRCLTVRCYGHERVEPKQKLEMGNDFWAFAAFYRVIEAGKPVGDEGDRRPVVSQTSKLGALVSWEGRRWVGDDSVGEGMTHGLLGCSVLEGGATVRGTMAARGFDGWQWLDQLKEDDGRGYGPSWAPKTVG
jgi:hypothetical protein